MWKSSYREDEYDGDELEQEMGNMQYEHLNTNRLKQKQWLHKEIMHNDKNVILAYWLIKYTLFPNKSFISVDICSSY